MALQDITITASIDSFHTTSYGQTTYLASSDDQSYPLEEVIGGYTAWPTFVEDENYTTNLFVNVTQSWSSSYDSPVGTILTIHDTMEEFVNGEFSGSILDVADQSLLDPNCESALQVGTTPITYTIFLFNQVYGNIRRTFFNAFLNQNTIPNPGEIYFAKENFSGNQCRLKYAKIAKIDALGNDNTLSLQALTKITYTDSTAGQIVCNVVNISEYPSYFYYEIISNDTTNLILNEDRKNFTLALSTYSNNTSPIPVNGFGPNDYPKSIFNPIYGTWTPGAYDSTAIAFNAINGVGDIEYKYTPNMVLGFTSSITATFPSSGGGTAFNFYLTLTDSNYNVITRIPWPGNFSTTNTRISGLQTITVTGSFLPIISTINGLLSSSLITEGMRVYAQYQSDKSFPANSLSGQFTAVQSVASVSAGAKDLVLEPYLTSTYNYTDCDVLINNAIQNDVNDFRRRVLYENGSLVPSNFNQIISGTAELAELNDYLYDANANYRPRYSGVRSTSPGVNLNTTEGGYGTLPNVESLQTYFAYFDFMQTTTSELLGKSAAHIKYLIDKDGVIQTPTLTGSYYANLLDNFETDKKANIIIYNESGDKVTIGNKTVLRPGALPRAILESQVAFDPTVVNGISFGTPNNNISGLNYNYNFIATYGVNNQSVQQIPTNGLWPGSDIIYFTTVASASSVIELNSGDGTIKFKKGNQNYLVRIEADVVAYLQYGTGQGSFFAQLAIQYSDNEGASWTILQQDPPQSYNDGGAYHTIVSQPFSPVENRLYRIVFSHNVSPTAGAVNYLEVYIWGQKPGVNYPNGNRVQTQIRVIDTTNPTNQNYQGKYSVSTPIPPSTDLSTYLGNLGQQYVIPIDATVISATPNVSLVPATIPGDPDNIQINTTSANIGLNFNLRFVSRPDLGDPNGGILVCRGNFILQKSTNGINWANIETKNNYTLGFTSVNSYSIQDRINNISFTTNVIPQVGDLYRIVVIPTGYYSSIVVGTTIQVVQTSVSVNSSAASTSSIYWTTGSTPSNILTSSYFAPYWTEDIGSYTQNSISELYGPNLPFTIKPYTDQIRFQADELQTYVITDVYLDPNFVYTPGNSPTASLIVTLNKNIGPGTNINSFLIRRYYPNASYVTMDSEFVSGSGFLVPQYITNDIRDNFDKIIINLKERTLI